MAHTHTHTELLFPHFFINSIHVQDLIVMIMQYLHDEGYNISAMTLQDESNVKMRQEIAKAKQIQQVSDAILGTCQ